MARRKLDTAELAETLSSLPGWSIQAGKLHKQYKFASFAQALGWMVSVGVLADKMNHHPEWCNVYNRVTVDLSTHDLGAISTWDVELAQKMDGLAAGISNS